MQVLFNYNGILALEARWLWENNIMSNSNYKQCCVRSKKKNNHIVLRHCAPNCPAVISYESLFKAVPYKIQRKIEQQLKVI
jgi:hypothetical protein